MGGQTVCSCFSSGRVLLGFSLCSLEVKTCNLLSTGTWSSLQIGFPLFVVKVRGMEGCGGVCGCESVN